MRTERVWCAVDARGYLWWPGIGLTRKQARMNLIAGTGQNWPTYQAEGWTIEKVTVSHGWAQ